MQRWCGADVRGRGQVPLLGRVPPHGEGEPAHGQPHATSVLPTGRPVKCVNHRYVVLVQKDLPRRRRILLLRKDYTR
uniref:Uncharacterized protein n=1 Tax=Arundo donax TaxID=35708 RepID=A0A0A8XVQ0_ARUDO